jgi:uncharacterized protein (TIGR04562 family)
MKKCYNTEERLFFNKQETTLMDINTPKSPEKQQDFPCLQIVFDPQPPSVERPLPWQLLSGLVQGLSIIEQTTIQVRTAEEAHHFLMTYGYDLSDPQDVQRLSHLVQEAVSFIENRLLEAGEGETAFARLHLHVPNNFLKQPNIVDLLCVASALPRTDQSRWACAILKVVHTLTHIEHAPRLQIIEPARQQILKGYGEIMRYDLESEKVIIGRTGSDKQLALYGLEIKEQKSRESLLIKLLSKKENSIELIDDFIGIRIITESIPDVLVALDILMESQLLVFSNVKAERSRNTLIALDEFQSLWQQYHPEDYPSLHSEKPHAYGKLPSWMDLLSTLQQLDAKLPHNSFSKHNPHSDNNYRALHITTRQLIKVPARGDEGGTMQRLFFPYEIQFIDKAHYIANQEGDIAHSRYKQRQLQRCRRRILGDLLPRHYVEQHSQDEGTRLKRPFERPPLHKPSPLDYI